MSGMEKGLGGWPSPKLPKLGTILKFSEIPYIRFLILSEVTRLRRVELQAVNERLIYMDSNLKI
jgi:hypothetical protein